MSKKNKKEVISRINNELGFIERGRLKRIQRDGLHKVAAHDFDNAMAYLIHVMNLLDNQTIPWSLPADAKARAEALSIELTELFRGAIIPRVERLTRRDACFQQFIGKLTQ